jgi:tryptophan synthase beta chain
MSTGGGGPRRCTAPGGWTRRRAETGEEKVIRTAPCGHGHFDMSADDRHPAGAMEDLTLPRERIGTAPTNLPAATS